MTIPLQEFYFVRHGETEWNRERKWMGSLDIPLNDTGLSQADDVAHILKLEPIKQIVTSPALRAKQTAKIIGKVIDKPITILENLKECCWGVYEGQPSNPEIFRSWLSGNCHEGAESLMNFTKRVSKGLTEALCLDGPILIVSHGGAYVAISKLLGMPLPSIYNCAAFYHKPPIDANNVWTIRSLNNGLKHFYD